MRVVLQPETEQVVLNWSKLTLITLILEKLIRLLWSKFVTTCFLHDVSFALPGGNGRDSGIAGCENMGMGFKFQTGMGWKWEWSHWNGRELVRKICSRRPLVQWSQIRFNGVLSHVWLGLPGGRLQCDEGLRIGAAATARWWSSSGALRAMWPWESQASFCRHVGKPGGGRASTHCPDFCHSVVISRVWGIRTTM